MRYRIREGILELCGAVSAWYRGVRSRFRRGSSGRTEVIKGTASRIIVVKSRTRGSSGRRFSFCGTTIFSIAASVRRNCCARRSSRQRAISGPICPKARPAAAQAGCFCSLPQPQRRCLSSSSFSECEVIQTNKFRPGLSPRPGFLILTFILKHVHA